MSILEILWPEPKLTQTTNTVKFLIGISPQGVIPYISKGWGGRVSEKHLTENCRILNNLLPGDQILAGLTVGSMFRIHAVGLSCAEIKIPPFTKNKKQLSRMEVDTARKYAILESTLPINV